MEDGTLKRHQENHYFRANYSKVHGLCETFFSVIKLRFSASCRFLLIVRYAGNQLQWDIENGVSAQSIKPRCRLYNVFHDVKLNISWWRYHGGVELLIGQRMSDSALHGVFRAVLAAQPHNLKKTLLVFIQIFTQPRSQSNYIPL
jgi:hypothetical protein